MAKRTIACRVCGKLFIPCNKSSAIIGAFNYHSITCSPECGVEYLHRVQEARNVSKKNSVTETEKHDETAKINADVKNSIEVVLDTVESGITATRFRKNRQGMNEDE